jgi:hypothetical protein
MQQNGLTKMPLELATLIIRIRSYRWIPMCENYSSWGYLFGCIVGIVSNLNSMKNLCLFCAKTLKEKIIVGTCYFHM